MTILLICPLCGQKNDLKEARCSKCGEDLSLYSRIFFAPDILYNTAINLAGQGETKAAVELLLSANRMKPADTDIIGMLVELYIMEEDYGNAIEKCLLILELNPNDEKINKLLEELSEKINERESRKKKLQGFLKKSVSDLYSEITGDMVPAADEALRCIRQFKTATGDGETAQQPNEKKGVSDSASDTANAVPNDITSDGGLHTEIRKIWGKTVLCVTAAVLIMLVGFGSVYWKLSDNISLQTNMWAKTTEGKITKIAEDLTNQVKSLQTAQDALSSKIDKNDSDLSRIVTAISADLTQVEDNIGTLSGKFDTAGQTAEQMMKRLEDINKEIKSLKANIKELQDGLNK